VFFNRVDDLASLEDNWTASEARFFVMWGRRRVGKTELLTHFSADKRALYFEATEGVLADQLADLSAELARVSGNQLLAAQPVTSWDAALVAIEQFVGSERTIMILDEFQYLAAQDAGLGSTINRWWRSTGRNLPIVLVLAGSEVGFFEREVLGGSMYGRRTGQLQLLPFNYRDAALFHPGYSYEDRIRAYAVCGGMPYYLERFDDGTPLREHILRHALYRDGFLYEEADLLLRQELPDPRNHIAVLRAIAQGQTQNSKIANRTGLDDSQVSQTVKTLERMQLVRVDRPITAAERSKKTSYTIVDGFLNFYFRFVDPAKSRLRTRAEAERYVDEVVVPQLDHFVSKPAFELICQDYVRDLEQAAGVGAWWGQVPTGEGRRTESQEIDIVALDYDGTVNATGSCKWTADALDFGEENLLVATEPYIPKADNVQRHYFCSREGFTEQLEKLAADEPQRIKLVTPETLYA
jgi:AAA+ ATPase superfamily predicted ATPase